MLQWHPRLAVLVVALAVLAATVGGAWDALSFNW